MRLTSRDRRLVRDIALSHVLSRDQILKLGYFGSVTRANTRLRILKTEGLVKPLDTPFYSQLLYVVGPRARDVVGERIALLIARRHGSPRFLQHALSVTNVRIMLLKEGSCEWRFEQQLRTQFRYAGSAFEARPDGMVLGPWGATLVEVDLGHVSAAKFKEKLRGFDALLASGMCQKAFGVASLDVLAVTTGRRRAALLRKLLPRGALFQFRATTFDELQIPPVGGWS